ncbi:MAG: DUF2141 domain-containing protein [Planctomycetota bacterium]
MLLLALSCAACGNAQVEAPPVDASLNGTIVARVTGLRNSRGRVMARLYRGKKGFPSDAEDAYRELTVEIKDKTATIKFENVPHGEYALWICHDEDKDGKLDSNFIGIPKEGVGVSGPPPSFIPSYSEARFTLDSNRSEHEIKIKYL